MAFLSSSDDVCQLTQPSPIPNPYWVAFSRSAAELIDLSVENDGLPTDPKWLEVLAGNALETSSHHFNNPISTAYSGHQFGIWAGQLGDGRAILLGEIRGQELQLKGAGKTIYSRMGDGRAVLRSSIREFLCSEAMHALGIPTTRALSVVGSDLAVRRETIETAAVCARLAPSFIRIGHFEHFAAQGQISRLQELATLLIKNYYPHCASQSEPVLELFKNICERNATLVAQWQAVGFCHGVLNSDNISALGLTMDYGPFGFIDQFDIAHICNHSDHSGRYAYHRQPQIMHWNMACLANALAPLLQAHHDDKETESLLRSALDTFPTIFADKWQLFFRKKLGFQKKDLNDIDLIERLLMLLHDSKVDFTTFFRQLSRIKKGQAVNTIPLRDLFVDRSSIDQWFQDYLIRLEIEVEDDSSRVKAMNLVNPKYVLRNHLAQVAIEKAQRHDFSEVMRLLEIITNPFSEQPENEQYAVPPLPGTAKVSVSCSS
jgi:uncharacterized protein YdiU (UPF0061 family)